MESVFDLSGDNVNDLIGDLNDAMLLGIEAIGL